MIKTRTDASRQIDQLRKLTDLMLDAKLLDLKAASAARQASLDRLADLDRPALATDLAEIAAAEVAIRYLHWADQRRSEINLTLARQTVTWIEARDAASLAFGKSQALQELAKKKL